MNHIENRNRLLLAIVFTSFCLRAPLTGVGALIGNIQSDLSLSAFHAGMITTIPLLAFAAISPLVGHFSGKRSAGTLMLYGFAILLTGIVMRSFLGVWGLFLGTLLVGVGIAVGNVLVPALIKCVFPERIGTLTSVYTTAMGVFAGLSPAITVPLVGRFGWQIALFVWFFLAAIAWLLWLPHKKVALTANCAPRRGHIMHSRTAACVALYMGMQSTLFYCFVAWLPTILAAKGFSPENAGLYYSIYQLLGIPAALVTPFWACRKAGQQGLTTGNTVLYLLGMLCIMLGTSRWLVAAGVVVCGLCAGVCICLAMLFIGLRTENASDAAKLSGMSQSAGYLIAAVGPSCMGVLYDWTNSWSLPLLLLVAALVLLLAAGRGAGANRKI